MCRHHESEYHRRGTFFIQFLACNSNNFIEIPFAACNLSAIELKTLYRPGAILRVPPSDNRYGNSAPDRLWRAYWHTDNLNIKAHISNHFADQASC